MTTKPLFYLVPFAALLLLVGCGEAGHQPDPAMAKHMEMMKADSIAEAQKATQEATVQAITALFNEHNIEGLENLMNADFVDHQQDPSIKTTGIQGAKDFLTMMFTAFPDFKQEIISMSTTDDMTYAHIRMTGTNTGPWGDMPATGKTMDVLGCDIIRFTDGKASEHWGYMEEMKMMTQLGLMPPPGEEPNK